MTNPSSAWTERLSLEATDNPPGPASGSAPAAKSASATLPVATYSPEGSTVKTAVDTASEEPFSCSAICAGTRVAPSTANAKVGAK